MGYNRATYFMRRNTLFVVIAIIAALFFTSCAKSLVPRATSTINSVGLRELNLVRADYKILNTIEATARVQLTIKSKSFEIKDPDGNFTLLYKMSFSPFKKAGSGDTYKLTKFKGILTTGYLTNDYGPMDCSSPEEVVRRIAIYRCISLAKEQGADGIIEPVISTNVEQTKSGLASDVIMYQTTVSGKAIVLKTDK